MYKEELEKDKLLFNKGERGSKFYIILKGQVGIFIPTIIATEDEYEDVL